MTEEQAELVSVVRDFATTELAPNAVRWDQEKFFPVDTLAVAGELGLGAIYAREEFGGSELTRQDAALIFEELAKGDTTIAAYISIHNMVVWMIDSFGNEAQRAEWIPGLASMTQLASYCLTEPEAGSDAAALVTSARRDGDHYVINGVKQFISGAGASAVYVVMARTGEPGTGGITAIIVPAESAGLSFGSNEKKMGWNAQPTRQVIFDDVRVPVTNALGIEGSGFGIAMKGLNGGRLNMAACSLGGAQWALEATTRYMQERKSFGKALVSHQALLFRLADMEIQLQAARTFLARAAEALQNDADDKLTLCAAAKKFVTDAAFAVANEALQLHGGYGYLSEYGIEKVVRDLRVHQILEGTNEIMSLIVGRALTGSRG
jgi:alkylation response protein AidB-like acyl-CoA dehydrogenase